MSTRKIFAIIGSASSNSSNHKLVDLFTGLMGDHFTIVPAPDLKTLPHFDPMLSTDDPPGPVINFRKQIEEADGVLISTPEYIFSIPSGLKNAIEWCVATTVFSDKPLGIITASAHGQKGHEELQMIMRTVMAKFTEETTLLIHGIKGKLNGEMVEEKTMGELKKFVEGYRRLLEV
jgi:NAD(P)H-dependent FMN reductase